MSFGSGPNGTMDETQGHGLPGSILSRNAATIKTVLRIGFGAIWLIDGALKFSSGVVANFADMVASAGDGQPGWLSGWFSFWAAQAAANPSLWVYLTGTFEVALGLALVFGFLRKLAYLGGILLSLLIWAVPEGFGGPYGPSSTDVGTGIVYAMVFLFLLLVNATYGSSRWSLDRWIERRWPKWALLAELREGPATVTTPARAPPGASG